MIRLAAIVAAFGLLPVAAAAEVQLSFYGGLQSSPHSGVTVRGDSVLPDADFTAGWEGRSLDTPPYYGVRATWWRSPNLGFGLDMNHTKVYADDETLSETGYDHLEFSDGLNIVTVNAYYRWPEAFGRVTPYVGGGVGVAVPHVELREGASDTFGYQVTGPAAALIAGVEVPISEDWSVFGEYKGTYSMNEADLDSGGTLETDIVTNALNVGVSFNF
ncbi:outer membrane beta-barrel protein [Wenxinia saemankumensis]|uniref:Lipid A oxidase n=1 Tax=Wenxinia saemankumensis TaxID=1447782 RepID=A0A1M6E2Y9_9RHOB|nr:outer membrane beta-barrel protein [Wenxinia saemankumensis]SHI79618.1 lipid A oxidase [Wenxinia saemankumensis]